MVFFDSFEGPGLDSFWTMETTNGTITVPSATAAHSGTNSVQFNSTAGLREIFLRHDFATPVYGRASVWVYDTGADLSSSNYLTLQMINTGAGQTTSLGSFDYDLGAPNASSFYNLSDWGAAGPTATSVDRTQAWHLWEINSTPTAYDVRVDGLLVYSDASGLAFDHVRIGMFAPAFRPNWEAYFDDFSFEEYESSTVPEPASIALLGATLGIGALTRFRRRKPAQSGKVLRA